MLTIISAVYFATLARTIHELVLRDCEDERATWQPQGLEFRT